MFWGLEFYFIILFYIFELNQFLAIEFRSIWVIIIMCSSINCGCELTREFTS